MGREKMAKSNTYVLHAIDTEGEKILDDERIVAMTDKAAWTEAVERAFLKVSERNRQGILGGMLAELSVTRL